jgi:DNA-binding NtrC family response regulator
LRVRCNCTAHAAADRSLAALAPGDAFATERHVVLATDLGVPVDLLPDSLLSASGVQIRRRLPTFERPPEASLFDIMDEFERRVILEQLEKSNWSQTETAESFRIPLSTLNQKIKRLNIEIKRKRDVAHANH